MHRSKQHRHSITSARVSRAAEQAEKIGVFDLNQCPL
jgi:hypothetical protein